MQLQIQMQIQKNNRNTNTKGNASKNKKYQHVPVALLFHTTLSHVGVGLAQVFAPTNPVACFHNLIYFENVFCLL